MTTELTSPTEAGKVVDAGGLEAIIFIPAIGRQWDDPSIEGGARRIATAIDRQSANEKAKAHVETAEQEFGAGYKCKKFTIIKTEGKTARPVIDIFGLNYNDTLVESYAKRNLFTKTILLAITLLDTVRRMIFRAYKQSKSLKEKIQLAYGLMVFVLLVAYLVLLIAAVVSSVEQLRNPSVSAPTGAAGQPTPVTPQTTPTPVTPQTTPNVSVVQQTPQAQSSVGMFEKLVAGVQDLPRILWRVIKGAWNFIKNYRRLFPPIIVLVTALGFVLPPKVKLKENISTAATNYLCLIHYLNWGERTHAIGGKLESLIEFLVESEKGYRKIHIIGYSFGSIVAIDNLFAAGRKPIERFKKIDTLVTIGCPFDIIRTYWPSYFTGRQTVTTEALKWINVYSPMDILSSNFADGGNDETIDQDQCKGIGVELIGVEPEGAKIRKPENILFSQGANQGLGVIDILTLTGFKAHSLYWGEEAKGEITCFHEIVAKMYQGTPILN